MIKSLINKMYAKANKVMRTAIMDERGDTNFISILIILGIVIVVAGVFIGFKDQIVDMVGNLVNGFTIKNGI